MLEQDDVVKLNYILNSLLVKSGRFCGHFSSGKSIGEAFMATRWERYPKSIELGPRESISILCLYFNFAKYCELNLSRTEIFSTSCKQMISAFTSLIACAVIFFDESLYNVNARSFMVNPLVARDDFHRSRCLRSVEGI